MIHAARTAENARRVPDSSRAIWLPGPGRTDGRYREMRRRALLFGHVRSTRIVHHSRTSPSPLKNLQVSAAARRLSSDCSQAARTLRLGRTLKRLKLPGSRELPVAVWRQKVGRATRALSPQDLRRSATHSASATPGVFHVKLKINRPVSSAGIWSPTTLACVQTTVLKTHLAFGSLWPVRLWRFALQPDP